MHHISWAVIIESFQDKNISFLSHGVMYKNHSDNIKANIVSNHATKELIMCKCDVIYSKWFDAIVLKMFRCTNRFHYYEKGSDDSTSANFLSQKMMVVSRFTEL